MLRRRKFFQGRGIRGVGVKDIAWYEPRGREMTDKAWDDPFARCLGVLLNGNTLDEIDERGEPVIGDTLFLMFNAHYGPILFRLPVKRAGERWERLLDTADEQIKSGLLVRDHTYKIRGRSVVVLRLKTADVSTADARAASELVQAGLTTAK